jgi:hypothetical protein
MKNTSKLFVRHTLSMFLAGSIALGTSNMAVAADKDAQSSKDCADQKSATMPKDDHETSRWERNLRLDGVELLEAQLYGNTCFTPYGSCAIANSTSEVA